MFNLIVFLGAGVALAVFGAYFLTAYREAKGTAWQRALASAKGSATILFNYVVAAGGILLLWADQAAQFFSFVEVQTFMKDHLTPTKMGIAMTIIALLTILARARTLRW